MPQLHIVNYSGQSFQKFMSSLDTFATKTHYANSIRRILAHSKLENPDDFVALPLDKLEDLITSYLIYLKNDRNSPHMAKGDLAAFRKFCKMNKITLNWDIISQYKGKIKLKKYSLSKDGAYSRQQIWDLLKICDIRTKAIVLLLSSTGVRVGAVPDLERRHLEKIQNFYKVTVYGEDHDEYFTFCTPECAKALDDYFAYRERYGEKLTPNSPLIRDRFDIEDLEPRRTKSNPTSIASIGFAISKKLERLGIREVDHTFEGFKSRKPVKLHHGFRKFFRTQLLESRVDYIVGVMLMGQELKLESSYSKPSYDFMISEYKKAIPLLTIDQTGILQEKVEEQKKDINKIDLLKLEHERQMSLVLESNKRLQEQLEGIRPWMLNLVKDLEKNKDKPWSEVLKESPIKSAEYGLEKTEQE